MRTVLLHGIGLVLGASVLAWDGFPVTNWIIEMHTNAPGVFYEGYTWSGTTEFNLTSPQIPYGQYIPVGLTSPRRATMWPGLVQQGWNVNLTMLSNVNPAMIFSTNIVFTNSLLGRIPTGSRSNTLPILIFGRVPYWVTEWDPGNTTNPATYFMDCQLGGVSLRDSYNQFAPGSQFQREWDLYRGTNMDIGRHLQLSRRATWRDGTGGPWVTNTAFWYPRQWSVGLIISNARGTNGNRIATYRFPDDHYLTGLGDD